MTMGLHNDDVAFFLAADEPATYLQVLTFPLFPSQMMWAAIISHCTLALRCQLRHGGAATGPAALETWSEGRNFYLAPRFAAMRGAACEGRHVPKGSLSRQ